MLKKIFLASFLVLISLPSFSAETTVPSEKIKIDFHLNTKASAKKNHLKINTDSVKHSDFFDAVSGASKNHSTMETRKLLSDSFNRLLCPKGLRALLLFPVSHEKYISQDSLQINSETGEITVSFNHRGTSYLIKSDRQGKILVPESFFIKNSSQELQKSEPSESQAESPLPEEQKEMPLIAPPEGYAPEKTEGESQQYKGILSTKITPEGTLIIKGKLNLFTPDKIIKS